MSLFLEIFLLLCHSTISFPYCYIKPLFSNHSLTPVLNPNLEYILSTKRFGDDPSFQSIKKLFSLKQPPEVFYKEKCSYKFRKIHRKTPVPEFHFNIKLQLYKKEILAQVFSCEFCEISKNTFFTEHLWTANSVQRNLTPISHTYETNSPPMHRVKQVDLN